MAVPDLLRRLLEAQGPSGYESAVTSVWREAASSFAEVSTDLVGSAHARIPGRGDGPLLALLAHVDEIGVVVTHVEDSGLLAFRQIGGNDASVLIGQRVDVLTRSGAVRGVVARRRLSSEERRDRPAPKLENLHVDIGARDADEARAAVAVGDPAVIVAPPLELLGGRFASRALDNRLGAYVVLEAARLVAEAGGAAGDVVAVASAQEEIGDFGGARTSAYALEPRVALAVDVTPANDVPGGDPRESGAVALGKGPVLTRGSTLNPALSDLLRETAEAEGIAYSVEVSAGETHTDADAVHLSRAGIPTGLVSLPIRYVHTPVETAQLSDVEDAARLIAAFALRLDADTSFAR